MVDAVSVALRTLSFIALFQAAGIAFFLALFGVHLTTSASAVRRLGVWSAILAFVFVSAHYALEAARVGGDLSGVLDSSLQQIVLTSASGAAFGFRVLGLATIAIALCASGGVASTFAAVGATLTILGFTLTGHTAASDERWLLGPVLAVHLLVVAFWFGALWPLHLVTRRESALIASRVIDTFSSLAVWLVPIIALVGAAIAVLLLPNVAALAEPYGQLLIAKSLGFALLLGLAAVNKSRLGPAVGRGTVSAARAFRVSLLAEYLLICGVLGITAAMTTYYSP